MSSVVREISAFYEVDSPHAVNRTRAAHIYETSATIMGKYTGAIAVKSLQAVRIPLPEGEPLQLARIRFSSAAHSVLLSGRPLKTKNNNVSGTMHVQSSNGALESSKILVHTEPHWDDPMNGVAVSIMLHEMGHSFGLAHCATSSCVLTEAIVIPDQLVPIPEEPFCPPCAEELEIAGHMALAQQL